MSKSIGCYKLTGLLGKGTYGDVRMAEHNETKVQYACKCISKDMLAKNEATRRQLYREISIMKSLVHENVVKLYDVLQTPNNIYLIVEWVRGGELLDVIDRASRLDEDKSRHYFQQLICALYYVHNQGISHRDIKPENLLVTEHEKLKVSDFGLSNVQEVSEGNANPQHVPEAKRLRSVCGTPNYVAPEVLKREGYNGFKSDVWSCGVVLYVMLTGQLPFHGANTQELLQLILTGTYEVPKDLSPGCLDIIRKMLEVDPEKRLSIGDVTNHPWFKVRFDRTCLRAGVTDHSSGVGLY